MPFFQTTAALFSAVTPIPADAGPVIPFYQSPSFINTVIFVGLIIASSLIGRWLAKYLRVADYGVKFGIILFAILASAVVVIMGWPPKLGVDLGGGSILDYKVDHSKTIWTKDKMDSLIVSISKRVNPGGVKEISVVSLGDDMVQITMPSVSGSTAKEKQAEAEQIRKIIRSTGALEFRIVANNRDNASVLEMAKAERKKYPVEPQSPVRIFDASGKEELAKWCRVRDQEVGKLTDDQGRVLDGAMQVGEITVKDNEGKDVQKPVWDVLVLSPVSDAYNVTGIDVSDARSEINTEDNKPEVSFSFNSEGGRKFGRLTGEHVPVGDFKYHLAIVLDDVLQTAPSIVSQITDKGRITGNFTEPEVQEIVDIINAGSLPAALEPTPVRDMQTDAILGHDTIVQSTYAMIIAAIAVPVFMIFYYHFAGLVAVLVLGLNMLMLVALMILIKAPFTLPALAGLALTVGMAVDNNVLIYERLREELAHGAALRMAIRNSFHRVGVVIIDANITHLIAATVLWSVGTEQIKGFAVTFWLGAVLSIWATMFVAKVIFEVSERRRWVQKMKMMQWIGHTSIDFMAWFPACATFSVIITVLGIVVAMVRGHGLFDIDFTGGVSVQTVFRQEQKIGDIRKEVDSLPKDLPDATVTPAHSQDEPNNTRFIIDTSNSTRDTVEGLLKKLFGERLVTLELSAKPIAAEKLPAGAKSPGEKAENSAWLPAGKPPASVPPASQPGEKPSEPPVDRSAPKSSAAIVPEKMVPDKTPDKTPPDKTLPDKTLPGTELPANKPAEPKPKQSRSDLPDWSLVAMVGNDAVLLAQADTAAKTAVVMPPADSATKPAAAAPTMLPAKDSAKPAAEAPTMPPAKDSAKPASAAPAMPPAKDSAKPAAETPTMPPAKDSAKPAAEATTPPPSKIDSAATDATAGQPIETVSYQALLTISSSVPKLEGVTAVEKSEPVQYDVDRLKKLVVQALVENKIPAEHDEVRIDLSAHGALPGTQPTQAESWDLKLTPNAATQNLLTPEKFQSVLATLMTDVRTVPYFPIVDNIGSAVANETKFWAVVALVSSWSLIILYLWIRFQGVAFGVAAVIALIHDVLVMLGAIAFSSYLAQIPGLSTITFIEPFKINLPIVAAFLTIIGYSVNDTIVVFDRIREIRGKSPTLTRKMVNDATNQTLSRTVLTSFTVMMVVVILYLFGGQAVHGFAFALIIGVLTGTYSSIYVAAPILLWLLHPKEMSASSAGDKPAR